MFRLLASDHSQSGYFGNQSGADFYNPTLQTQASVAGFTVSLQVTHCNNNSENILSLQDSSDEPQRLHFHQKQNHPALSGAHLHRPEGQLNSDVISSDVFCGKILLSEVKLFISWPLGLFVFPALMIIMTMNQITVVYMYKVLLMKILFQISALPKQTTEEFCFLTVFHFIHISPKNQLNREIIKSWSASLDLIIFPPPACVSFKPVEYQ